MKRLLPTFIGVGVGWILMASIPVLTVAVVALWMLINPEKSKKLVEEMSGGFIDSIQSVLNVSTQPTSMDSDGEDSSPTGGASHGTE